MMNIDGKRPYLVVFLIQTIYTGMFLLSKAAFDKGMNSFVFVFYRQAFATVFLVPVAVVLERKKAPPLSLGTFCKIFALSLLGITASLNVNGIALVYTSATLAAATTNTLPVITFFLAVLVRMESVKLKTLPGIAKIVGVALCLFGAATLAFYKGPHLKPFSHHHLFGHQSSNAGPIVASSGTTWVKGCFLMLTSNILWGLWLVLQVKIMESYPSKLLFTTLQCFLSAIQSFIIAIAVERDVYKWKLSLDIGLLAVVYCGIFVTGITFYLQSWCIESKGPVFLAMSTPLSLIMTIFCSAVILGELVSLGSILGGVILVGGLYSVLWGKSREQMNEIEKVEDGKSKGEKNSKLVVEDQKACLEIKDVNGYPMDIEICPIKANKEREHSEKMKSITLGKGKGFSREVVSND